MEFKLPQIEQDIQPCDYYENGILMCGKCHTPKQWKGHILGQEVMMPSLCKCATEERDKKEAELKAKQREDMIAARRVFAFGDSPMQSWTFEMDDGANPIMSKRAKKYVENFQKFYQDGKGLLLYGNTGTGKTFIACCIANALIDKGYLVNVTNVAQIANGLFETFDKTEYMERLLNCPLLVLDDLGIERKTEYMNETVYNVIDGRYRNGKPTIVTTNMTAKQIREPDGIEQQRILSRIKERCIALEVDGDDRRVKKARSQYADDLKLLDS